MINNQKEKDVLRKKMFEIRRDILDKERKSNEIIKKIIKLDIYKNAKVIGLYKSLPNEVIMDELINYTLSLGKIVVLPKVVGNKLIFFKYKIGDLLEQSNFKVLEPLNIENNRYDGIIDLLIVPGLCFDNDGNRLGYGKGYYDNYLKNNNITYKIGVCFSKQLIKKVPVNENDVSLDMVITEK